MIHYKKILVLLCLLSGSGLVYAQESHYSELTALLRQLDQMQGVIAQAGSQPIDAHSRYHFDYQRLDADLAKVRSGIEHYLTPSRAQPRDMTELIGDYQQETAPNRGKR